MTSTQTLNRFPPRRVHRSTIATLARVEAGRLAMHPVLLGGTAITLGLQASLLTSPMRITFATEVYYQLGSNWFALVGAAFVVGNLAALRDRPTTTAEAFRAMPTTRPERTGALLLACVVPAALALLVSLSVVLFAASAGGVPLGDPPGRENVALGAWEIVSPVAITTAAFTAGVAAARTVPSRAVGGLVGTTGSVLFVVTAWAWSWFPMAFLIPYTTAPRSTADLGLAPTTDILSSTPLLDQPDQWVPTWHALEIETARVGWHSLYMIGLSVLCVGYALVRSQGPRRARWLVFCGAMLAVAGVALQIRSTGETFGWMEQVSPA